VRAAECCRERPPSSATPSGAARWRLRSRQKRGSRSATTTSHPASCFAEFNPEVAALRDRGRDGLTDFRGKVDALIADSSFNALDLREVGFGDATVVPLLLDVLSEVPRRGSNSDPVVLTVNRLAPNKRVEDVIKSFAIYQRRRAHEASLVVIGSDRGFESYRSALEDLVARVGARRVFFTGQILSAARDAWYRYADVYLSMSVHEGFCAPLIESLAHGLPVVARAAGAAPETVGGAGLVLDGDDPAVVAESVDAAASSQSTREALFDAAGDRLSELWPAVLAPRIHSALAPLLDGRL
jgi:glycosyltransferase involved in cell wall biosynthesis